MIDIQGDNFFIYSNPSLDPSLNLATEEYLLKQRKEAFLILWRNEKAIVTGKHQVSYREVNFPFCQENGIAVHRRLSGGGTVYHDMGNLNFTLIENRPDKNKLIDFKRYLEPVAEFLNLHSVPAYLSERNDLLLNGYKISGNAQHVEQKLQRVIHHGTLLLNSDLGSLGNGLKSTAVKYETRAVDSVRSKVMNISDHLSKPWPMEEFITAMKAHFIKKYSGESWEPLAEEMEMIRDLAESKYSTWDWNIGYSPRYSATISVNGGELTIHVKNGVISEAEFNNGSEQYKIEELEGLKHRKEELEKVSILKGSDWRSWF